MGATSYTTLLFLFSELSSQLLGLDPTSNAQVATDLEASWREEALRSDREEEDGDVRSRAAFRGQSLPPQEPSYPHQNPRPLPLTVPSPPPPTSLSSHDLKPSLARSSSGPSQELQDTGKSRTKTRIRRAFLPSPLLRPATRLPLSPNFPARRSLTRLQLSNSHLLPLRRLGTGARSLGLCCASSGGMQAGEKRRNRR